MPACRIDDIQDAPQKPIHTILVVDDEELICLVVAEYLRDCGFHVVEAASGDAAVEILQSGETKIDLVFSDIQMPGKINGLALAKWLRVNQPEVRVMLTSGHAGSAASAAELCEHGPLLQKPYEHQEVLKRVRMVIGNAGYPQI